MKDAFPHQQNKGATLVVYTRIAPSHTQGRAISSSLACRAACEHERCSTCSQQAKCTEGGSPRLQRLQAPPCSWPAPPSPPLPSSSHPSRLPDLPPPVVSRPCHYPPRRQRSYRQPLRPCPPSPARRPILQTDESGRSRRVCGCICRMSDPKASARDGRNGARACKAGSRW